MRRATIRFDWKTAAFLIGVFLMTGEDLTQAEEGKNATGAAVAYPKARPTDTVDDYHGTKVADPYRWLEDPDSEETRAWVEAENRVTFGFLESIPERNRLRSRLKRLWNLC